MRVFFMCNGRIESVAVLDAVSDDATALKNGAELFLARLAKDYDGFEIWERDRLVFRYPDVENENSDLSSGGRGSRPKSPGGRGGKENLPVGLSRSGRGALQVDFAVTFLTGTGGRLSQCR